MNLLLLPSIHKKTLSFLLIFCTLCLSQTTFAQKYSPQVKEYFKEIAMGSEFGRGQKIAKWTKNMKIFVMGSKIPHMETELNKIIRELNQLVSPIRIQKVSSQAQANFVVFFGSSNDYVGKIEPNAGRYAHRNLALFYVRYTPQGSVKKGSMYVNTAKMRAPDTRQHLLREELTQALGLMKDSYRYPKSIFYQKFSRTNQYTNIDKKLIRLLYNNKIQPGMTKQQVDQVLRTL